MTPMEPRERRDCLEIVEQLSEYLDGELNADARTALEAHLRYCPECQTFLASLRQTMHLLHQLGEEPSPLPPALEDRLLHQMRQQLTVRLTQQSSRQTEADDTSSLANDHVESVARSTMPNP